ncbi:hypothetical protein JHK87_031628 [Glycine soja]|nr:hypothetical protein JHK87_031628 [Glycine soja]
MPSMVAQKTHILSTQIPIANTTPDQNQINKYVFYSQFLKIYGVACLQAQVMQMKAQLDQN